MPFAFLYILFFKTIFFVVDAAKGGGPKSSDLFIRSGAGMLLYGADDQAWLRADVLWYCLFFFQSFIVSQRDLMFNSRLIWFYIFQPIESTFNPLMTWISRQVASVLFVRV